MARFRPVQQQQPQRKRPRGPRRKYRQFDDQALKEALKTIKQGSSINSTAKKYGISRRTLQRHTIGVQVGKVGKPYVFSAKTEHRLTRGLIICAVWGFPLTHYEIRHLVKRYLDHSGKTVHRFKNNLPGYEWVKDFVSRQSEFLTTRLSENIKRARAAVTPEIISEYFEELGETLDLIPAAHILNYDETNMKDDPGRDVVVVRRGSKHAERIVDSSKGSTSVMFCASASGDLLPPYVVYKSDCLYRSWMQGGPSGTRYNRTKSGWFDGPTFEDWFFVIALPYLQKLNGSKAIVGDNLASHISISVIRACEKNNVKFVFLPPNATHLAQPLDVAVFAPLKKKWRDLLREYKVKHKGTLKKEDFPKLLKTALNSVENSAENIISGFKKSGIHPVNKQKVLDQLPKDKNEFDDSEEWENSFTSFIKEHRKSETSSTVSRRKKVSVPAGKSITEDELIMCDVKELLNDMVGKVVKEVLPAKRRAKKRRKAPTEDDESDIDEPEEVPLHTSTPKLAKRKKVGKENAEKNTFTPSSVDEVEVPRNAKAGDILAVQLRYNVGEKKESMKQFVCKVINVNVDFKCKFMRNYKGKKDTFIFPQIDDISDVKFNQVLRIMKPTSVSRDRFTFSRSDMDCFEDD